jgi:hypothetical protein
MTSAEAQELLSRFASDFTQTDEGVEDNSPLRRKSLDDLLQLTDDAFSIAAQNLSEGEIISCIQTWIKDDKTGFLVEAVENQCTSLTDINEALERYHQLEVTDEELEKIRDEMKLSEGADDLVTTLKNMGLNGCGEWRIRLLYQLYQGEVAFSQNGGQLPDG